MITVVGPYVLTIVVHLAQIMQSLNFFKYKLLYLYALHFNPRREGKNAASFV